MAILDKRAKKILKKMYKNGFISYEEANKIASNDDLNSPSNPILALSKNDFIYDSHGSERGYHITIAGRAFIEDEHQKFWSFFVPYAITTALAVGSLIADFI